MAGEIFISYRRADQAWARLLHSLLQAEGVEAWYDAQVGAGQDWRIATAKALEASQIFVLLFSENAAQSSDIAKELAAATLEKKLIIPVRLENIAPKGAFLYELASRNWVNAYENTEAKLAELAKGLAHLVRTGARDESVLPFDRSNDGAHTAVPSPRRSIRKSVLIAAGAIAVLAASGAAAWLLWPATHWTVESGRPFISTFAMEADPAFSPDGAVLAYAAGPDIASAQIYIRNIAGGEGVKVSSDPYFDSSPSWSSDGVHLAYLAQKVGEPCHIMVTTVPAGEAHEAGRCSAHEYSNLTWQPGTSFVYYIDGADFRVDKLFRLDLEKGTRLELPGQKPSLLIRDLRCSPNGKSLAYLDLDGFMTFRVVVRDLASGTEKTLGHVTQSPSTALSDSLDWSEDSKTVLVSTSNGAGTEIVAFPAGGSAFYHVYATATPATHIAVGAGGRMALETDQSRTNLARAGVAPITQPDIIDPANGLTFAPTFAPDGTLAFLSNRSGTNAVWLMKPGAAPAIFFDAGNSSLFRENFSPDGKLLAVAMFSPDGKASIRILNSAGAAVTSFDVQSVGFGLPTWSPDGKGVFVFDRRILRTVRVDLDNSANRTPVAPEIWQGISIYQGHTFATRDDRRGIWRIDGQPQLLNAKYPTQYYPPIALKDDDVLIPDFLTGTTPRIWAQPIAGGPDRAIAYAPGGNAERDYSSAIAVNPKTGEILYVASVLRDTNIDLLTLARR